MAYSDATLTYTQDTDADDAKQFVDILFPAFDGGDLSVRKDTAQISLKIYTAGDNIDAVVYTDNQTVPIYVGTVSTTALEESLLDVSDILGVCKTFQLRLLGLVSDFKLVEAEIIYDARPQPLTYVKYSLVDFGITSPNKKKIRSWPITLECLDGDEEVTITPYIDNVAKTALTVNHTYPKTVNYQFTTDEWGTDFALVLHGCCAFELYKVHAPVGVQVLPVAKRFDQVGPEELFRWGKLQEFQVRIIAFGGTSIPVTVYFEETEKYETTFTVVDGKEGIHSFKVPRTISGQLLKVEFGPTTFDFHLLYVLAKVSKSGRDTENEWVQIRGLTNEAGN